MGGSESLTLLDLKPKKSLRNGRGSECEKGSERFYAANGCSVVEHIDKSNSTQGERERELRVTKIKRKWKHFVSTLSRSTILNHAAFLLGG